MKRMVVALVAAALLLPGLSACGVPGHSALPAGITVSVFQNRLDYSPRVLELEVANGTDGRITATSASFVSTRFESPATWADTQDIPAGGARDLKVSLQAPRCDAVTPAETVELTVTLADGRTATGTVVPTDEEGRLDIINNEDCLAAGVAAIAPITPPDALRWTPGAHSPAELDLAVTPTGAAGSYVIDFVKGTVLIALVDSTGAVTYDIELGQQVSAASGPSILPLMLVPNRCDAHAIIEDKRGTFMPLGITTADGQTGTVYVAVSDDVRRSIYEFYSDYCGLAP